MEALVRTRPAVAVASTGRAPLETAAARSRDASRHGPCAGLAACTNSEALRPNASVRERSCSRAAGERWPTRSRSVVKTAQSARTAASWAGVHIRGPSGCSIASIVSKECGEEAEEDFDDGPGVGGISKDGVAWSLSSDTSSESTSASTSQAMPHRAARCTADPESPAGAPGVAAPRSSRGHPPRLVSAATVALTGSAHSSLITFGRGSPMGQPRCRLQACHSSTVVDRRTQSPLQPNRPLRVAFAGRPPQLASRPGSLKWSGSSPAR